MKNIVIIAIVSMLAFASFSFAEEERLGHFEGKEASTLEVTIVNLTEANARLRELLKKTLEPKDVVEIHELSYTAENALAEIAEEQVRLAALMEEVHLASESGASYLKGIESIE